MFLEALSKDTHSLLQELNQEGFLETELQAFKNLCTTAGMKVHANHQEAAKLPNTQSVFSIYIAYCKDPQYAAQYRIPHIVYCSAGSCVPTAPSIISQEAKIQEILKALIVQRHLTPTPQPTK